MGNIFEDIVSGNIDLENDDVELFTEAYYPDSIPYLKTIPRLVNLPKGNPQGMGNCCYLYSKSINQSIDFINNAKNFSSKRFYTMYYYNLYYQGKLWNKRYRIKDIEERKSIYKKVKEETGLLPLPKFTQTVKRNMFFEMSKYIEIFESICSKLSFKRYIPLYWEYFMNVYSSAPLTHPNRFVVVDMEKYPLKKTVKENLSNPLYIIFYTLYKMPEVLKEVDIDYLFFFDRKVLKINPSKLEKTDYNLLKTSMYRLIGHVNSSNFDKVTSDKVIKEEEIESDATAPIVKLTQSNDEVIQTNEQIKKIKDQSPIEIKVNTMAKERIAKVKDILDNEDVDSKSVTAAMTKSIQDEIDSDKEMIKKLYYQNKQNDLKKSAANTARDNMLREKQKEIKIKDMTIADIQKIQANKVDIPVNDVTKNVKTTNENIKQMKFRNTNKTYVEKVMAKDIANDILALNNKSIPMFVRDISVEDTSDELNYKETYTIQFEDSNRKRHTVKVDIPKFIDDEFLYIGGNKKIIKHQDFYLPIVKISPTTVEIVTNYSKMTIERVENKSISSVERLKKLVNGDENLNKYFVFGNGYPDNKSYITTIEYDDLSKKFLSYKNNNTHIMFNQKNAREYMKKNNIPEKDNMLYIGKVRGKNCYVDINTQVTNFNESIVDTIVNTLPEEYSSSFLSTKGPKRTMYTKVKIMKQFVTVGMLLGLWEGISNILKAFNVEYRLEDKVPTILKSDESYIKFSDCVLVYKDSIPITLVLNGFSAVDTTKYTMLDFDEKEPYLEYIKKVYGNSIIENALMNFYEFLVDPITKEVLEHYNYPTDVMGIFVYAINLLADSQHSLDIDQNLCRVRKAEIIPAILYDKLAKGYVQYRNSNGKVKFSIPQDAVIKEILGLKTVEDYSTLNPMLELEQLHAVSSKGFRGVNLDQAYTMKRRGYDPSMIGIIAPNTSPDGSVGVSRSLTLEPSLDGVRGYSVDVHKDLKNSKDVNLFSPGELALPMATAIDDPTRLGLTVKGVAESIINSFNCWNTLRALSYRKGDNV